MGSPRFQLCDESRFPLPLPSIDLAVSTLRSAPARSGHSTERKARLKVLKLRVRRPCYEFQYSSGTLNAGLVVSV